MFPTKQILAKYTSDCYKCSMNIRCFVIVLLFPFMVWANQTDPFQWRGRLQVDSGWVMDEEDASHHFTDGTVIRRLWLNFSGQFPEGWGYVVTPGFGGDTLRMQDMYLNYNIPETMEIRFGQMRRFNGLESEASNNNLPFLERTGMTNAFRPRRNLGVGFYPYGEGWGSSLGIFSGNMGGQAPGSENLSLDGRFFIYPQKNLFLGANLSLTDLQETEERYAARGESTRPEESLVNTGLLQNVQQANTSGVEAAFLHHRWTWMAEWQHHEVRRDNGNDNHHFQGGYLAAIYSLTGETRPFEHKVGGYGAITPKAPLSEGGIGAWEVALRRSYLDLSDGSVRGGRLDSTTLGLNWYPEDYLKFMLNYQWHQTDAESRFPHADPQFLLLRAQVLF